MKQEKQKPSRRSKAPAQAVNAKQRGVSAVKKGVQKKDSDGLQIKQKESDDKVDFYNTGKNQDLDAHNLYNTVTDKQRQASVEVLEKIDEGPAVIEEKTGSGKPKSSKAKRIKSLENRFNKLHINKEGISSANKLDQPMFETKIQNRTT